VSSVTLVHPVKAAGQHELPFGRDTRVVPNNVVLDRGPDLLQKGEIGGSEPQFPATPFIAKLLWPLVLNRFIFDKDMNNRMMSLFFN